MNILWHHRPRYNAPETSGSNLRLLNFARELERQGHGVYLFLDDISGDDNADRDSWARDAKANVPFSGIYYGDFAPRYSPILGSIARKLLYPPLVNAILGSHYRSMSEQVLALVEELKIDAFVCSLRDRLWLIPLVKERTVTVVDWCDSYVLASARALNLTWKRKAWRNTLGTAKALALAIAQESYYGRVADVNLLASPIDTKCFTRFARVPQKTHVLYNGLPTPSDKLAVPKVSKRLIFSGRMDFPPNHEAAMWFTDAVMPILVKKDPGIVLVIAGADPLLELRSRESANVRILGFVEDMGVEIAASELYVAPMRSGSGFKNKVAEAIINGTFVAGTSLACEFLEPEIRELLLVGDEPRELAAQILRFLADPQAFDSQLGLLRKVIVEKYDWEMQARNLIGLIEAAHTRMVKS